MTNNYNTLNTEDGSTYDYSNSSFSLCANKDKVDYLINREGKFKVIDEMLSSEAIVGAFKNLVESTISSEKFKINPSDTSEEAKHHADLIWQMLNDMEKPLVEYIKDFSSAADYGFALFEMVFKKRLGYNLKDPRKNSQYNDGLMAPRKFASRPQKTIEKWNYDKYNRIDSVIQVINYLSKSTIPYSKLLHFTVKSYNDNPEGTSVYKNLVYSFKEKQRVRRIQLIRFARGFDGVPVIRLPASWADKNNSKYSGIRSWAEQSVKNLRLGQDSGMVLPSVVDSNGNELLTFEIISGNAPVGQDPEKMLDRFDREMATSLLADFFLSGKTASVSGSLGQIKVEVFTNFVVTILNNIVDQINHKLIPIIFDLNGWDMQYMPSLVHSNLAQFKKMELVVFLQSLKASKMMVPSYQRDNALSNIMFNGMMPEVSEEEWQSGIQQYETNYVDNLDSPTIDSFDEVSGGKPKEDTGN